MDISAAQYLEWDGNVVTGESWNIAFPKIEAIISVRRQCKENPDLKDFYYIRGILRNRLSYHHPQLTIKWLKIARDWGATIEELKEIACSTKNWTTFSNDIDLVIEKYKKEKEDNAS